ncbi:hypothetical protein SeMB42_g00605 [Synchytrium endobioticum]|uniref:Uncharacterized protein n=1 Tax=Synchytrium endobioticum TaxID=286115 RepID=A0A507DEG1_9FUNG|nr:hypothetical protein SeLEV6574_g01270 [Synchytrium endobioticum]TPX53812.1 hypothetical protein SeMB42_g00605 [Synchytrium endobioticum]
MVAANAHRRFKVVENGVHNTPQSPVTSSSTANASATKPCRPTHFLQLARTWDMGGRYIRERILEEFLLANASKTGPQIERELGGGASLFLTRVTAWLRLTYLLGHDLSLQLRAIAVLVGAADAPRFMAEFLEIGGVLTIVEILGLKQISETDKADAVRLLLRIAQAGRPYKEFICDSYGIRAVGDCLAKSRSIDLQEPLRDLLVLLGTNNPKYTSQVFKVSLSLFTTNSPNPTCQQMSGIALRQLLPAIPSLTQTIVENFLTILKHPNPILQSTAYEILRELAKRPALHDFLLSQSIAVLKLAVDPMGQEHTDGLDYWIRDPTSASTSTAKTQAHGNCLPPTQVSNSGDKNDDYAAMMLEASMAVYQQQAHVAKLLGVFAATSDALGIRMVQMQVVSGLLNTIANIAYPKSQHFATNTLLFLTERHPVVAKTLLESMGENFYDLLQNKPDTFYRELNKEQVRFLRRNTVKVLLGTDPECQARAADASTLSSEEDLSTASPEPPTKKASQFPAMHGDRSRTPSLDSPASLDDLNAGDAAAIIAEFTAAEKTAAAALDPNKLTSTTAESVSANVKMYTPFAGPYTQDKAAGASFASNPFVSSTASQQASDRFDSEFERFKATIAKVSNQTLETDPTADALIQKLKVRHAKVSFDVLPTPSTEDPTTTDHAAQQSPH